MAAGNMPLPGSAPALHDMLDRIGGHFPGHAMQRLRTPDGRYRYTHVSPGVRQSFGLEPEALLAQDSVTHDWVPLPDRTRFVAALEHSAATLTTLDEEVRVLLPDGRTKWVRSIGHPRRLADGSVIWDGVALDITDRQETRAALERAMEAARQAESSGAHLVAIAAGELAQPVAQLRDDLATLRATLGAGAPPRVRRRLDSMAQGVDQLGAALGTILSMLRAGRAYASQPPPGAPATLTARQREVLALMQAGLTNREIAARLGIAEGTAKLHVAAVLTRTGARNRVAAALGVVAPGTG